MTTQEFSDSFDTLLSSYITGLKFGEQEGADVRLNEYEKSVFLTKAQEEIVLELYTGKNPYGESFEQTEELRRYLGSLVSEKTLTPSATTGGMPITNHYFITLPQDLWFITYESVTTTGTGCEAKTNMEVYPTRQDEFHKMKKNPFRGANERRALRLDLSGGLIEIVCNYTVSEYYVRYLKKLSPIILTDLPDGLKVGEESTEQGCSLHKALHQKILERAVELVLRSRGFTVRNNNENR
jgi:hypothetical protein